MNDKLWILWTLEKARLFCIEVESFAPEFGYHVALTGGVLYKEGPRADLDLIFYRYRKADKEGLLAATLCKLGVASSGQGWRYVGFWDGLKIDFLFPEERTV